VTATSPPVQTPILTQRLIRHFDGGLAARSILVVGRESRTYTVDQVSLLERLGQNAHGTGLHRLRAHLIVGIAAHEDNRQELFS